MKHLKKFNENSIGEDTLTIRDVFQDIFDDYNIYEKGNDTSSGLFYSFGDKKSLMVPVLSGDLSLRKQSGGQLIFLKIRKLDNEANYLYSEVLNNIDFSKHIKRLENMGYGVTFEYENFSPNDKYYDPIISHKISYVLIIISRW